MVIPLRIGIIDIGASFCDDLHFIRSFPFSLMASAVIPVPTITVVVTPFVDKEDPIVVPVTLITATLEAIIIKNGRNA